LGCPTSEDRAKNSTTALNENPTVELLSPTYGASFAADEEIKLLAMVQDSESSGSELCLRWASAIDGHIYRRL
jgi:hypothetical protein